MPNEINKINVNGTDYNVRDDSKVLKSGDTMTGDLTFSSGHGPATDTYYNTSDYPLLTWDNSRSTLQLGDSYGKLSLYATDVEITGLGDVKFTATNGAVTINSDTLTTVDGTVIPRDAELLTTDSLIAGSNITITRSPGPDLELVISSTGGGVTGPSSSVNNNIAVFNGTSGKIIKDSGVSTSDFIKKDGSVAMTGTLKLNTGCNIVAGEDDPSSGDFTISAKHTPTSSEHSIVLTKVDRGSGIKFIQKSSWASYGKGYHQLPADDGSDFDNDICFTLATVEKSLQKSGDTMTGSLTINEDNKLYFYSNSGSYIQSYSGGDYLKIYNPVYDDSILLGNSLTISHANAEISLSPNSELLVDCAGEIAVQTTKNINIETQHDAVSNGNIYIEATDRLLSLTGQTVLLNGDNVKANGNEIATQPWVQSNPKYTITVSSGVMTVKENY